MYKKLLGQFVTPKIIQVPSQYMDLLTRGHFWWGGEDFRVTMLIYLKAFRKAVEEQPEK